MKLTPLIAVASLWLLLMFSQQAQAGATLRASDLVVVDFQQDDTDRFKVLGLAPIPANSVLFFTDAQWLANGNLSAENQGNTEWQFRWTSPATLVPAGTPTLISHPSPRRCSTRGPNNWTVYGPSLTTLTLYGA